MYGYALIKKVVPAGACAGIWQRESEYMLGENVMLDRELITRMYKERNKYNSKFKAKTYMNAADDFCVSYKAMFREMLTEIEMADIPENDNEMPENDGSAEEKKTEGFTGQAGDKKEELNPKVREKIMELAEEFTGLMAILVRNKGKIPEGADVKEPSGKEPLSRDMLDINMYMVMYVCPCILDTGCRYSKELTEAVVDRWNSLFKKNNVSYSDYETINSGFRRKLCYITTAVCDELGYEDDCEALTLLREFRDGYLASIKGGSEMIEQYYEEAPAMVCKINTTKDKGRIYRGLYEEYINPCVNMIKEDRLEDCLNHYKNMVQELGAGITC